ncbi:hypothetical protein F503_06166 [Ophiostoma piceae UAMH 11346]|uniref:Uncharacterized protein n=1 Tax=Ophiostoma piceae (strain UAMH 11346) TaxID=1262450 RepID=S3BVN9_OPHP1|nr:hypothetical protein F503_06166 [Ophiostoma piceae UAMH 11346]
MAQQPDVLLPNTVPPTPDLPFLSQEPRNGEPSCAWENFKRPRLRKFPQAASTLQFQGFIGAGVDGLVLGAKTGDNAAVAVKIFYYSKPCNDHRYWAFQRECCNSAVLEMIRIATQRSGADSGAPLYLLPTPRRITDAVRNLRAFSTEYSHKYRANPPPNFEPFDYSHLQLNECLGWTQLDGGAVRSLLHGWRLGISEFCSTPAVDAASWYFAIVYRFVPDALLEDSVVLSHMNFFYRAGFDPVPFKADNWRGPGILVDLSDLVLPFESDWQECIYGPMVKRDGRFTLGQANRPSKRETEKDAATRHA